MTYRWQRTITVSSVRCRIFNLALLHPLSPSPENYRYGHLQLWVIACHSHIYNMLWQFKTGLSGFKTVVRKVVPNWQMPKVLWWMHYHHGGKPLTSSLDCYTRVAIRLRPPADFKDCDVYVALRAGASELLRIYWSKPWWLLWSIILVAGSPETVKKWQQSAHKVWRVRTSQDLCGIRKEGIWRHIERLLLFKDTIVV